MAHTLRRRRVPQWESYVLRDYIVHHPASGGRWLQPIVVDPRSDEGRRLLARFHSDRPYQPGPSRAFLKPYHHRDRQAFRGAIRHWLERGDHDFLAPTRPRHEGQWRWY